MQISDKEYARLKKDADDNRQLVKIVLTITIGILLIIGYFGYGRQMIQLHIRQQEAALQNEIDISKAKANTAIKEIEQTGMSFDEYVKWLEIRDELYSK